MYEFDQAVTGFPFENAVPSALGSNGVTREFCNSLPYETLADEHWNECRTLVTAAHWCQASDGAPCSREDIAYLCDINPESRRPSDCASYVAELADPPARRQVPTGRSDIRELQNWLVSIGCPLPTYGVDGRWGTETSNAVACAESQGQGAVIQSRFPFVSTMRVTPTGQPRPPDFAFDPGISKKTPEQVLAAGNPGGAGGSVVSSGSTQADIAADQEQRAGLVGALPWWGWTLVAVGGVGVLAFAGFMLLGDDDEGERR